MSLLNIYDMSEITNNDSGSGSNNANPDANPDANPPPVSVNAIIQINKNQEITVLDAIPNGKQLDTTMSPYELLENRTESVFAVKITKKVTGTCTPGNDKIKCITSDKFDYELDLTTAESNIETLLSEDFLGNVVAATATTSGASATTSGAASGADSGAASGAASATEVVGGARRGVDNVGNSCWANGIYQMLYDAEDFRNYIIDTNWGQKFFTEHKMQMDKIASSFGTFTETDKQSEKDANPDWSWLPKNTTPDEYKDIFGHLLKQIFKHIHGDNDVKITYETSLIPVLLFPDAINEQQDSTEFIHQLKIKTEQSGSNSKNLLTIDDTFGLKEKEKKYYLDDSKKETGIILRDLNPESATNIMLKLDEEDEKKTDLTVQTLFNSKKTETGEDPCVKTEINLSMDKLKVMNPSATTDDLNTMLSKNSVCMYSNKIHEYSDFSKYLLVTLVREKKAVVAGEKPTKQFTKVVFDEKLTVNSSNFKLIGVVVHSGETPNSGHYFYESIQDNHEYNDSAKENLYTHKKKDEIEKNWTILLYKKEDSIAGGSSYSDMPIERPRVPGGSRKNRQRKSKKTKRKYYVYKK
jgi:hypothetical protein